MYILIVLGYVQRVYPNTHCSDIDKSMGLQWVLSDASVVKGPYKTHVNEIYFRKEFVHEPIENQRNKTSGLGL